LLDNLSIKQLVLSIVLMCGGLIAIFVILFSQIGWVQSNLVISIAFIIIAIAILYSFISKILEKYIFSKLRIIYKFINKSKSISVNQDIKSIDDVNTDVMEWAQEAEQKIESLRVLADYRKDFVGNVSHELKTPIFSLQGYLHTLLEGGIYDENINLKYLRKAAENADRLQHIVEDLESIGQMESGNILLEIESFDIKELINEVISDQKISTKDNQSDLVFENNSDSSLFVLADKESIRQVLNNLINNSIKYGEKNGLTKVRLSRLDKTVLVEVSDNGIGIESKHLEHLFDRFYRIDKSRSRAKGGSGLGLSIVKHLLEAHGQTINVNSTLGEGSTFGFTLALSN